MFICFLGIYYITGIDFVARPNCDDYPFGVDTTYYMRHEIGIGSKIVKHCPTAIMRAVFLLVSKNIKVLNAAIGALNVITAFLLYSIFMNVKHSTLCACI